MADRVLAGEDVFTQLRLAGRGLGILADFGVKASRDIKDQFRPGGLNMDLGNTEPVFIRFDPARPGAPVVLDADAQQWFTENTDPQSPPQFSDAFVVLSWAGLGRESGQAAVRAGDRRIGVLTAADSEVFQSYLDQGIQQNRPVVTQAALQYTPDATWRLTVYPAQHQRLSPCASRARRGQRTKATRGHSRVIRQGSRPGTWRAARVPQAIF